MRLPNFFIAGVPKAGTTSLFHYLKQHPQIYMSPLKEPHYFASEMHPENFDPQLSDWYEKNTRDLAKYLAHPNGEIRSGGIVTDRRDYLRLFEGTGNALAVGEASVGYLWSPTAPFRIASEIPEARIVLLLRDPAERAFSQYLHGYGSGAIRWSFREHIERSLRHRSKQICVHYPFLEFGFYAEQVRRYRKLFGDHVWIGFYEDYRGHPLKLCRALFNFLGVDAQFTPDVRKRYFEAQVPRAPIIAKLKRAGVWETTANLTPRFLRPWIRRSLIRQPGTTKIDPANRRYLVDLYRENILTLARDLDRNLDSWLA